MDVTRILAVAFVAAGLCGGGIALADTLLVQSVDAAQASAPERPARGKSMASVEARFGAPTTRSSAVGRPPITRWDYPEFSVFFEFDHVVHSVRH
jgi:hypothetical protein